MEISNVTFSPLTHAKVVSKRQVNEAVERHENLVTSHLRLINKVHVRVCSSDTHI